MPNAIAMLKADHVKVRRLLRQLGETSDRGAKQRERLVSEIEREIKLHSQLEEEVFYPAFQAAADGSKKERFFYEAAEEHHVVDMELPSLKAADAKSHEFEAKAKVLRDLIEHHIREEEGQMFVAARTLLSDAQLRELGDLMQERRKSIQAMWEHPLLRPARTALHKMLPAKVKTARATAIAKGTEEAR